MKLNPDNVRNLLLHLEENLDFGETIHLQTGDTDPDTLYTATKLIEAGYIKGSVNHFMGGGCLIIIQSITWSGHQFLDNIRPETSWEKTKSLSKQIGGASLDILSKIAVKVTADLINGQLG